MKHFIKDNTYYILDGEEIILSIELDAENSGQIVLTTKNEVYSGPVDLISFDPDVKAKA